MRRRRRWRSSLVLVYDYDYIEKASYQSFRLDDNEKKTVDN